jgi:ABC-type polysaccharide/polyol phosphate export permease
MRYTLYGSRLMKESRTRNLLIILISGMGNVKEGDWKSILLYFSFMLLLGVGLFQLFSIIFESYYPLSQTMRTFLILVYLAVVFFWDGSSLVKQYKTGSDYFHKQDK